MAGPRDKQDRVFIKDGLRHYRRRYSMTEVRIGAGILVVLAAVLAWVLYKGAHPDPGLMALEVVNPGQAPSRAPAERGPVPEGLALEGWKETGLKVYDPSNVYEKIDGREGYYKSFGFQRLHVLTLEKVEDPTTLVDLELFDLGTGENALGAYSGELGQGMQPEADAGGLAHYAQNALYLTRGRYYLRALGSADDAVIRGQLERVRARFTEGMEGEPLPWAFQLFVGKLGLGPGALGYLAENAFGFSDFAADVHTGRLADESELFVKACADPGAAKAVAQQFQAGFLGYGKAKGPWVEDEYISTLSGAVPVGAWVVGVRGAPDVKAAEASLAHLKGALEGFPVPKPAGAAPGAGEPGYDGEGSHE
jgi:hypothetical protein